MAIPMLLNLPLTEALGRALLDFVWQGALLALALAAFETVARSAAIRHAAACLVMLAMPAVFLATVVGRYLAPVPGDAVGPAYLAPLAVNAIPGLGTASEATAVAANLDLSAWVVCLWLAGVLGLSLYTGAGWLRVQRLRRQRPEALDPKWLEILETLKQRMKISGPVRLCATLAGEVPAVIGFLRPVILLPVTAITGLDEAQLRAVLAHELAHIKRHDYVVNLLQSAVETLLFYHPAVWWVGRQIRREREHCCDDLAVSACGDVMVYAGALTRLEELRSGLPSAAMAVTGGDLLERIRRLTGQPRRERALRPLGAIAAAALALLIVASPMLREVAAEPQNPVAAPAPPVAPAVPPIPQVPVQAPPAASKSEPPAAGVEIIRDLDVQREQNEQLRVQSDELRMQMDELSRALSQLQGRTAAGQDNVTAKLNEMLAEVNQRMAEVSAAQANRTTSPRNVDRLIGLFDKFEAASDLDDARAVLNYLAESDNPKAAEKILSIARSDAHSDVRRAAIGLLAEQKQSFDTLVSLYDHESSLTAKRAILAQLAESDDPRVEDKLSSIAQSDPDPALRRTALALLAEH